MITWRFLHRAFGFAAAMAVMALPLAAQMRPNDIVRAGFLPGWTLPDGRHIAGLRLSLEPGWKTYWRVPGEAGIPPQIQLSGEGLEGVEPLWPEPILFRDAGVLGIGYQDRVIIPVVLEGRPDHVSGRVDIGVCKNICVPVSFAIEGEIPDNAAPVPDLLAALAAQPLSGAEAGIAAPSCDIRPSEAGFDVTMRLGLAGRSVPEHVVVEPGTPSLAVPSYPRLSLAEGVLTVTATLRQTGQGGRALSREAMRITLLGNGRAVELQGCA